MPLLFTDAAPARAAAQMHLRCAPRESREMPQARTLILYDTMARGSTSMPTFLLIFHAARRYACRAPMRCARCKICVIYFHARARCARQRSAAKSVPRGHAIAEARRAPCFAVQQRICARRHYVMQMRAVPLRYRRRHQIPTMPMANVRMIACGKRGRQRGAARRSVSKIVICRASPTMVSCARAPHACAACSRGAGRKQ